MDKISLEMKKNKAEGGNTIGRRRRKLKSRAKRPVVRGHMVLRGDVCRSREKKCPLSDVEGKCEGRKVEIKRKKRNKIVVKDVMIPVGKNYIQHFDGSNVAVKTDGKRKKMKAAMEERDDLDISDESSTSSEEDDDVVFLEEVINNPNSKCPVSVKVEAQDVEGNKFLDIKNHASKFPISVKEEVLDREEAQSEGCIDFVGDDWDSTLSNLDNVGLDVSSERNGALDVSDDGSASYVGDENVSKGLNVFRYQKGERKMRSTGVKSNARVCSRENKKISPLFWEKHPYFDPSAVMCSALELEKFVKMHRLEYMRNDIAPWYTTAQPYSKVERRYWTYVAEEGVEWVSRARAQHKFFFNKNAPMDESDKCVICHKYLICEYHQFVPVFRYEEGPSVNRLWEWKESTEKACLMHFYSSKAKMVPGRSPYNWDEGKLADIEMDEEISCNEKEGEVDDTFPDEY